MYVNGERSFYNWLEVYQLIKINPLHPQLINYAPKIRKHNQEFKFLTASQSRELLAAAGAKELPNKKANNQAARDELIIDLFLHSGMRASELRDFKYEGLALSGDRWIIRIPTAKAGVNE